MLNDAFDVVDLEKRFDKKVPRTKVGGFDLVYNEGPVNQEKSSEYTSFLGTIYFNKRLLLSHSSSTENEETLFNGRPFGPIKNDCLTVGHIDSQCFSWLSPGIPGCNIHGHPND